MARLAVLVALVWVGVRLYLRTNALSVTLSWMMIAVCAGITLAVLRSVVEAPHRGRWLMASLLAFVILWCVMSAVAVGLEIFRSDEGTDALQKAVRCAWHVAAISMFLGVGSREGRARDGVESAA